MRHAPQDTPEALPLGVAALEITLTRFCAVMRDCNEHLAGAAARKEVLDLGRQLRDRYAFTPEDMFYAVMCFLTLSPEARRAFTHLCARKIRDQQHA